MSNLTNGSAQKNPLASSEVAAQASSNAPESATAFTAPESVARAIHDFKQGALLEESFRILYETYHSSVRGFFARRLASLDECVDFTQETFLRVYRGTRAYRGDAPFGAWLFRIAWNALHSHRTRKSTLGESTPLGDTDLERTLTTEDAVHPQRGTGSSSSVLRDERRHILRQAVAELPPQQRKCVVLWGYQQLPHKEIATVMRLSIDTVKSHLAQARLQLEVLAGSAAPRARGDS